MTVVPAEVGGQGARRKLPGRVCVFIMLTTDKLGVENRGASGQNIRQVVEFLWHDESYLR
jgi:hypothetical protein